MGMQNGGVKKEVQDEWHRMRPGKGCAQSGDRMEWDDQRCKTEQQDPPTPSPFHLHRLTLKSA